MISLSSDFNELANMNFLAHLYLSGKEDAIKIGNFIGDFVKGRQLEEYPKEVQDGIRLHREIDFYTDQHPIVMESKDRLRAKYRHYAGVIVDVYYDHFLANHWERFHDQTLPDFVSQSYALMEANAASFPERAQYMLPYMVQNNWLEGYGYVEGIRRALSGMSRRTSFRSRMEEASQDLVQEYAQFEDEFLRFFPEIDTFCTSWLRKEGYTV